MATIEDRDTPIYYRPAIAVTLSLIAGILAGEALPGQMVAVLILFFCTVGFLVAALFGQRPVRWTPLLAVASAGYLSMVPFVSPSHGTDHIINYLDSGYWRITGLVAETPRLKLGRTRVVLETETLARDGQTQSVHGRIRLTVMGAPDLRIGDRLVFAAKIRSLRNFNNPGGFDYRRYMAFQGITGSAWVKAEKLKVSGHRPPGALPRMVAALRRQLAGRIDAAGNSDAADARAVLKALVFGDRNGIHDELREQFNRTGVGHLLAISGLHVGIVATVVYRLLVWAFSFAKPLLLHGWTRKWAAAVTMLAVLAYGILAGMSPSTQRAVIMVGVFLFALMLGRSHDLLNTLAVAALVILILWPPALFTISFQLSFAAVAAIVIGMQAMRLPEGHDQTVAVRAGRKLLAFMLVSALAIAGTTPLVLYHFNQTSLVGLAANLLLVPLVGFVVVPLGLAAALVSMVFESLGILIFDVGIGGLQVALVLVGFFSGLDFAAVKTVTPSLLEMGLFYLMGVCLLYLRKESMARWMLAAALVVAAGDGIYWAYQRFGRTDLRVTALDVGQGGAAMMELPGGQVLLYDGGGFADNRRFDVGRSIVAPQLWRRKIATVEVLILSHPNADHLNGLIYIARHFKVKELWTNGDVNTTHGHKELMKICHQKKIRVRILDAGRPPIRMGAVTLTVLHPPHAFSATAPALDQQARNSGSLVVQAGMGVTTFLFAGDLMAQGERQMVARAGTRLESTVLFAPHHGSRTSSSRELVGAVKPQTVLISAGAGNRFSFPHPAVVQRYRAAGSDIFCTCTHGAVTMQTDGKRLVVRPFLAAPTRAQ